ncbi:MAG: ABC transporter permease [Epulopiscium sp.]|nr:ABC transporter permease [Candidatus Epulonipiscium sp.]
MIVDLKNIPEDILNIPDSKFKIVLEENDRIFDETFETESIGFFKESFTRFTRNKASIIAFYAIMAIVVLAIIAPLFSGYSYVEQNLKLKDMPPRIPVLEKIGIADGTRLLTNRKKVNVDDPKQYPPECIIEIRNPQTINGIECVDVLVDYYVYKGAEDVYFWFGSDYLGRDLFTRLFKGARISLLIALLSVVTNVVIGVIYGSIAGYYGGKVDLVMMRIVEILEGLPYLVIVMLFILLFGTGMMSIILALTITGWIGTARLIRTQFYRYKGREYVLAARTLGVPDILLIFRHILPNTVGPLITRAMISVPGAIFSESFLAYIGLGLQPPEPSIGVLLSDGQKVLLQYPYQTFIPALLISVLMISFNLLSNGMRDALDPTQRGGE